MSGRGQTATTVDTLGRALEKEGYRVVVASDKRKKIWRLLDMSRATLRHARQSGLVLIDTYSTLNFYYAVTVAGLCRVLGVPYIPILHGGNLPKRLERSKGLSKWLFDGARVNVAPSGYLMEAFKQAGFTNLAYIPNTIALEHYPFKQRERIKPRLLWVRSFDKTYNPSLALRVVKQLKEKGVGVHLTMVGPDKDGSLDRCRQLAEKEQLPVTFTGKLEKLEWVALARDHDIFINTTHFDNTPVSVIEAMALGLPVVSTNVGGIPFLIDHQKDGILVPPNDAGAFTESIAQLLDEPERVRDLSVNARKKAEQFDWQVVKHRWFELLGL